MADLGAPRLQRSVGEVAVEVGSEGRVHRAFQSGSGKLRFPAAGEALVLNTSGGLAGGDRFATDISVEAGAYTVSTVACERVYRSEGEAVTVRQRLRAGGGAHLRHLPQPTILFDGGALERLTSVDLADDARLTFCEGLVLGRAAMGEAVRTAAVRDRIEVRVAGHLVFVDALRLTTRGLARLGTPAGLGEARGIGIVLHRGPDLSAALDRARSVPGAGASLVNGVLVARLLAPTHTALQDGLASLVTALDGVQPPRCWRL